jgi:hypothetical protein
MYWQYDMARSEKQAGQQLSIQLSQQLFRFLSPLLDSLDALIDKRLVRTLLDTVTAILVFRDRAKNLVLSELGAFLASPGHAPAGTKRLSNVLRCLGWDASLIERFLWQQATDSLEALERQGETPLVLWDESMLEKAESLKLEGLGSVRGVKCGCQVALGHFP